MNKGLLIGFAVLVIVLLGVPLLGALNKQAPASAQPAAAANTAASTAASTTTAAAPPPMAPAPAPAPYMPSAADFTNTAWAVPTPMGQATISLQPGGAAIAQVPGMGNVQGSWSLRGNTLTATAMGRTLSCQIQNGQLVYNGQPVQRVR